LDSKPKFGLGLLTLALTTTSGLGIEAKTALGPKFFGIGFVTWPRPFGFCLEAKNWASARPREKMFGIYLAVHNLKAERRLKF